MREAWRLNAQQLQELLEKIATSLSVFIIYNGQEMPAFHEVETKMKLIIHKLIDKAKEEG